MTRAPMCIQDSLFLAQLLRVLAVVIECARFSQHVPAMVEHVLAAIWTVRFHPEPGMGWQYFTCDMYLTGGMRAIMCGSHLVRACVCDCLLVCSRAARGIGVPGISTSRRRTPQVHVGGQLPSASDIGGMRRVGGRCDHERPGP